MKKDYSSRLNKFLADAFKKPEDNMKTPNKVSAAPDESVILKEPQSYNASNYTSATKLRGNTSEMLKEPAPSHADFEMVK